MFNKQLTLLLLVAIGLLVASLNSHAQSHPSLILTKAGVAEIRQQLGNAPLFDVTLQQVKQEIDAEIATGIHTPIPKGLSGGYSHERHKRNFIVAQKAGVLFQILQDEKYAQYVRNMLFQYEAMYKNLPVHPELRSYARGKLFWQCLNDSNWLVYMSQAYDTIYDWLTNDERQTLEANLFRPFADFISLENPQFYNRVHNHSTWGNAAVGMIGLVMNDEGLIKRALYGIKDDGLEEGLIDNDGGFIKTAGQKVGFLANLEQPFSPDGYYTEGPYYQRYAMYPFLVFALAMHNTKPEMKVFEHKDNVLLKAVNALLNLSDANGDFFPLNDAQKGMSIYSRELVTAVNIAYLYGGKNPELLSVAKKQNKVLLDQSGLAVAVGIQNNQARPFVKKSVNLRDGANGKQGGVAVLRANNEALTLVFKYAAHGLSHGHYDKLSFSLYEQGEEVIQDYGFARFVNIEKKGGGNYLKENNSWAKQSIAHNTVIQNGTSHFKGKYAIASEHHSNLHFFDATKRGIQIVSAKESNAYPSTEMHRTVAIISSESFEKPLLLDIMKISATDKNQYDLPYYFMGQLLNTNFEYKTPSTLRALGKKNGYQHLYLEGQGKPSSDSAQLSWLNDGKYYTLTTVAQPSDQLFFTRVGANDPEFNLRRDAGFMLRRKKQKNTTFVSVIEPHGSYSPVSELSINANSQLLKVRVLLDTEDYTAVSLIDLKQRATVLIVANKNVAVNSTHRLTIEGKSYEWIGPYYFSSPDQ